MSEPVVTIPKYTPLRLKLLELATVGNGLAFLSKNEEKCAFTLSRAGLLHFHDTGPIDYSITAEGRETLALFREKAARGEP